MKGNEYNLRSTNRNELRSLFVVCFILYIVYVTIQNTKLDKNAIFARLHSFYRMYGLECMAFSIQYSVRKIQATQKE